MKRTKTASSYDVVDFIENKNFYTEFYNIALINKKLLEPFSIEFMLSKFEPYDFDYWNKIKEIFSNKFSQEVISILVDFLKKYRLFSLNIANSPKDDFEMLQEYWTLINILKDKENVKIFNEYIIFLNKQFYKKQEGFKKINR